MSKTTAEYVLAQWRSVMESQLRFLERDNQPDGFKSEEADAVKDQGGCA